MTAHPVDQPLFGQQAAELRAALRRLLATGLSPVAAPVDPVRAAYGTYLRNAYGCLRCAFLPDRCADGRTLWEEYQGA
ncbi:hypothetical protein ACIRVK_44035 [Streptomyces sp. NPDC101152]|uniref:hypothetical protein n=1 Tax=Streptomyces sp. NPDC101152 TaxID=3366116 RepID=UPI00382410F4